MKEYILDETTYEKVCKLMLEDMEKGLRPETNAAADMKMLPTYVRSLPNGQGKCMHEMHLIRSIDLGLDCLLPWRGRGECISATLS